MSLDKVMLFICITGIIAAAIGCGIGYILRKRLAEAKIGSAEAKKRLASTPKPCEEKWNLLYLAQKAAPQTK